MITYASEYVDESDICYRIRDAQQHPGIPQIHPPNDEHSQTTQVLMRIEPVFHFVPREPDAKSARRRDGRMYLLNTTPADSTHANHTIGDVFNSSAAARITAVESPRHSPQAPTFPNMGVDS